MTKHTLLAVALLAMSFTLQAKPTAQAPKRGPIPSYFFKPVSIASTQYPEEGKSYLRELDFQVSVKAENTKEAWEYLDKVMTQAIGPTGFRELSEAEVSKFNLWKYNRAQTPGEAITKMFGSKIFYAAKDTATLQKLLTPATPFNSRRDGEMKGQIRQFFLRTIATGGNFSEGFVSFRFRFLPILIGSVSYETPKVQEDEVANRLALTPFFDAGPVLNDLKAKLETLSTEPEIKDLKTRLLQ